MDLEIYCAEFINIYVTNLHIFARGDTKSWGGPTQYPVNMDPPSLKLRRSHDESRAGDKVEYANEDSWVVWHMGSVLTMMNSLYSGLLLAATPAN